MKTDIKKNKAGLPGVPTVKTVSADAGTQIPSPVWEDSTCRGD